MNKNLLKPEISFIVMLVLILVALGTENALMGKVYALSAIIIGCFTIYQVSNIKHKNYEKF